MFLGPEVISIYLGKGFVYMVSHTDISVVQINEEINEWKFTYLESP